MVSHLTYPSKNADQAFKFLEKNTSFLRSLVANCRHDIEQLTNIIEPILNAPKRCELAPFYIQAVNTGKSTFLVTNLSHAETVQIVDHSQEWLIGRSKLKCSIPISELSISRLHAILGHEAGKTFFVQDVGSRNGTKVNYNRLSSLEPQLLKDGDLIEFGLVKVEFFITSCIEENQEVWLADEKLASAE